MDLSPQIQSAVDATLALRKEFTKKKSLLHDDCEVFLQVTLLKQPIVEEARRAFVYLAHPLPGNNADVCLFVRNAFPNDHVARTPDERIEFSIEHYKEILEKHKVKGISAIMPLKQLRSEYGNYELKRKLANRFDFFLSELTLLRNGKFSANLGNFFSKYHKYPIGVKFPKQGQHDRRFSKRIERALKTAYFDIKKCSDNYSIPVGLTSHTKEQLIENISFVFKQLSEKEKIPGGFENIKSILLKTERSKPVPIYFSLESKNNVPAPHVKSKTPNVDPVEGELSTMPGMRVIVHPNGEVVLIKSNRGDDSGSEISDFESESEEEEEEEEENEYDSDDGENKMKKKNKRTEKKKLQKKNEEELESEDDETETAEQQYLSNWLEETIEDEEVKEKETKPTKKQKKEKAPKRKAQVENEKKSKKIRKSSEGQENASKGNEVKAGKVKGNHVKAPKENSKSIKVQKKSKRTILQGKEKNVGAKKARKVKSKK